MSSPSVLQQAKALHQKMDIGVRPDGFLEFLFPFLETLDAVLRTWLEASPSPVPSSSVRASSLILLPPLLRSLSLCLSHVSTQSLKDIVRLRARLYHTLSAPSLNAESFLFLWRHLSALLRRLLSHVPAAQACQFLAEHLRNVMEKIEAYLDRHQYQPRILIAKPNTSNSYSNVLLFVQL
jgi:hypothetical protein